MKCHLIHSVLLYISPKVRFPYNGSMMQINTSFLVLNQKIQRKNESLSLSRDTCLAYYTIKNKRDPELLFCDSAGGMGNLSLFCFLEKKSKSTPPPPNQTKPKQKNPKKRRTRIGWSRHHCRNVTTITAGK